MKNGLLVGQATEILLIAGMGSVSHYFLGFYTSLVVSQISEPSTES